MLLTHHWYESINTGGIVLFWSFLWFSLVTNHPADDKLISEAEKGYLMRVIQVSPPTQVIFITRHDMK